MSYDCIEAARLQLEKNRVRPMPLDGECDTIVRVDAILPEATTFTDPHGLVGRVDFIFTFFSKISCNLENSRLQWFVKRRTREIAPRSCGEEASPDPRECRLDVRLTIFQSVSE